MKLIGIDIGKNKHFFCVMDQQTGEIISQPVSFSNDKEGFDFLVQKIKSYPKDSILIGMEDTGHYHFALLKYLLDLQYTVALINPKTTDFNRKMQGGITKNDKLDTINICDVLDTPERKKQYRISPDMSIARVYLSVFPSEKAEEMVKNINNNMKSIRYELGTRVRHQLRIIPELKFFVDDSLDYIEKIDSLLK